MKKIVLTLVVGLAAASTGCTNVERSRDLANPNVPASVTAVQVCSNCHGVDGNSVSPNFPRLAAQQSDYIVEQLTNFRGQHRGDPAGFEYMWGLSHHLTDAQIKGLADYFSKQAPKPNNASVDAKLVAAGKEIYEKGLPAENAPPCIACHGPKAEGRANFPRLANQHQDYLIKQLQVFKRTNERPNTPMTQVAHLISPLEMQEVTSYLQSLPVDK